MKIRKRLILLLPVFLVAGCIWKPAQRETTASEQPSQEQIPDQSEGWKIIEALTKAYGDNPNLIGDFILTGIHWFSRCGEIQRRHGRRWKRHRVAKLSG